MIPVGKKLITTSQDRASDKRKLHIDYSHTLRRPTIPGYKNVSFSIMISSFGRSSANYALLAELG